MMADDKLQKEIQMEGRKGATHTSQPTFSSECDANGICQRTDIYVLLHSGL